MTLSAVQIDRTLVERLLAEQFPQWAELPLAEVPQSGWDNRCFRLGAEMLVRLPSAAAYEAQVQREQQWLPRLAPQMPVGIPEPLALGRPATHYPWAWSIYRWIPGDSAAAAPPVDETKFALDLAGFLRALHRMASIDGPLPGPHNFHRGGALGVYDDQCRQALAALAGRIDAGLALRVWQAGLVSSWQRPPVWVHGDIALGNLIMREGRLAAVIDFGQLGVGDPACDLAIAWTFFRGATREHFRLCLGLDEGTWKRGRAWALWKAAIVTAGLADTHAVGARQAPATLAEILADAVADAGDSQP